jgi:hypothetical protein
LILSVTQNHRNWSISGTTTASHNMSPTPEITRAPSVVSTNWETQKHDGHLVDESLVRAENEDKLTVYLFFLIVSAALGGFLYRYDTGVVGVALPYVGTEFGGKALTN